MRRFDSDPRLQTLLRLFVHALSAGLSLCLRLKSLPPKLAHELKMKKPAPRAGLDSLNFGAGDGI
jgi:hypothetical protein